MEGKAANILQCLVEGCTLPVDLILVSSDKEEFAAHKANLGQFSDGFPTQNMTVNPENGSVERADFDERGEVLKLLLHFVHHTHLPDLSKAEFDIVSDLAEAAQKWQVFSASALCKMYMEKAVELDDNPRHALSILFYALKHGYNSMADKAAINSLAFPLDWFLAKAYKAEVPSHVIIQWIRYREFVMAGALALLRQKPELVPHSYGKNACSQWKAFEEDISGRLMRNPGHVFSFRKLMGDYLDDGHAFAHDPDVVFVSCDQCRLKCNSWVENSIFSGGLPAFSSLPDLPEA